MLSFFQALICTHACMHKCMHVCMFMCLCSCTLLSCVYSRTRTRTERGPACLLVLVCKSILVGPCGVLKYVSVHGIL